MMVKCEKCGHGQNVKTKLCFTTCSNCQLKMRVKPIDEVKQK